jgi:LmbE family N-acetylglucosaminyl deacetylase
MLSAHASLTVVWVVFGCDRTREHEARASSALFLKESREHRLIVHSFRDGFFPFQGSEIKETFEALKLDVSPDLIFTHRRDDRHQDHRVVADLTWQTFRDHVILEYEIPKYDGDLGRPNCYVPLSASLCQAKVEHLLATFASQREKHWFSEETFRGLMRLRGIECGAPSGYAEAFYVHKFVMATAGG